MANYFSIYWNDLTFEKQEEIRDLVRSRIKRDVDLMNQFEEDAKAAIEKERQDHIEHFKLTGRKVFYKNSVLIEQRVKDYIEEVVTDKINREFNAQGEV
jgi:hypothetical protein